MTSDFETRFPGTSSAIQREFDQHLHSAAQLYISQGGVVVADVAVGETASGDAMPWLSAGKPIAAVAIAQLWERGLLDLDDKVAAHIPKFGVNGKEPITIRHILTHTAGFRAVLGNYEDQPWDQLIATVCAARLEPGWIIGKTAGYHLVTSWYILGELIRRIDGRSFEQYVREMIFNQLGMTDATFVHPETGQVRPGSSARGPARELGLFYESLIRRRRRLAATLASPSSASKATQASPLNVQTIEAITARHRVGLFDKTFQHTIDWGLGFIAQSNPYGVETLPYSFGPHASPRTFGHGGSRSSVGYADPENELVVAAVFTRAKTEAEHHARMLEINSSIYEDLKLV